MRTLDALIDCINVGIDRCGATATAAIIDDLRARQGGGLGGAQDDVGRSPFDGGPLAGLDLGGTNIKCRRPSTATVRLKLVAVATSVRPVPSTVHAVIANLAAAGRCDRPGGGRSTARRSGCLGCSTTAPERSSSSPTSRGVAGRADDRAAGRRARRADIDHQRRPGVHPRRVASARQPAVRRCRAWCSAPGSAAGLSSGAGCTWSDGRKPASSPIKLSSRRPPCACGNHGVSKRWPLRGDHPSGGTATVREAFAAAALGDEQAVRPSPRSPTTSASPSPTSSPCSSPSGWSSEAASPRPATPAPARARGDGPALRPRPARLVRDRARQARPARQHQPRRVGWHLGVPGDRHDLRRHKTAGVDINGSPRWGGRVRVDDIDDVAVGDVARLGALERAAVLVEQKAQFDEQRRAQRPRAAATRRWSASLAVTDSVRRSLATRRAGRARRAAIRPRDRHRAPLRARRHSGVLEGDRLAV